MQIMNTNIVWHFSTKGMEKMNGCQRTMSNMINKIRTFFCVSEDYCEKGKFFHPWANSDACFQIGEFRFRDDNL